MRVLTDGWHIGEKRHSSLLTWRCCGNILFRLATHRYLQSQRAVRAQPCSTSTSATRAVEIAFASDSLAVIIHFALTQINPQCIYA